MTTARQTRPPKSKSGTLRSVVPSEADTLRAIIDYLEASRMLYVRINPTSPILDQKRVMGVLADVWARQISLIEAFSRIKAMAFRPLRESQQGAPDLIVYPGKGETLHVEVKSPMGKLRPEQLDWMTRSHAAGIVYYVVKSIDEFLFVINSNEKIRLVVDGKK